MLLSPPSLLLAAVKDAVIGMLVESDVTSNDVMVSSISIFSSLTHSSEFWM